MEQDILNLINGQLQPALGGEWLDNVEPATGSNYNRMPRSGSDDVEAAVDAARRAFPEWRAWSPADRRALLMRLADKVAENAAMLAEAEARDNGKPISVAAAVDIPRAEHNLRFYASAAEQFSSDPGSACAFIHSWHPCPRALAQIIPLDLSQSASAIESHVTEKEPIRFRQQNRSPQIFSLAISFQ